MKIRVADGVSFPMYVRTKDSGDLMRFDDLSGLSYLEAIDVRNDEYEAWDASGRLLVLTATEDGFLRSGDIAIAATDSLIDEAELRRLANTAKPTQ